MFFLAILFLGLTKAYAQAKADDVALPIIDNQSTSIPGGIVDMNVRQLIFSKIKDGVFKPPQGIEDIFLTFGSKANLNLAGLGYVCMAAYPGDVVTTNDPPRKPGEPPRKTLEIIAGSVSATTQLVVTRDVNGDAICTEEDVDLVKVFRITVTSYDVFSALQELKSLIGNIEGLEIRVVGKRIVLDGRIVIPAELERLNKVVENFNQTNTGQGAAVPILNLVEMSPLASQLIAEKMEEAIAGGPDRPRDITVKVINGRYFLEGSVDQLWQRQEAERVCQAFLQDRMVKATPGVSQVDSGLPECNSSIWIRQGGNKDPDPVINVRVDFVTLNREYAKNFLFSWRPSVAAEGQVNYESDLGRFTAAFLGTIRNLFPILRNAANHGYGRVLKSANLIIVDQDPPSQDANYIKEVFSVPVTVNSANGPVIQNADVTTSVEIRAASIKGSDKINMGITAQLSQNLGAAANGAPTTLSNEVRTSIVVTNGESAALGGMIGEQRDVKFNRSPTANTGSTNEGAVAFELFNVGRQHSIADQKSQFIVFVTPTKMRSPEQGTNDLKRKFRLKK
jgi:pilus assembly protein CpaC